jgi:hypothetical protein
LLFLFVIPHCADFFSYCIVGVGNLSTLEVLLELKLGLATFGMDTLNILMDWVITGAFACDDRLITTNDGTYALQMVMLMTVVMAVSWERFVAVVHTTAWMPHSNTINDHRTDTSIDCGGSSCQGKEEETI